MWGPWNEWMNVFLQCRSRALDRFRPENMDKARLLPRTEALQFGAPFPGEKPLDHWILDGG